jgi:hypothetical protein
MGFDSEAVNALVAGVASIALKTGTFRSVNTHEPKAAPGSGLRLAIWADTIQPIGAASGLASTSGYVVMQARAYGNMLAKPEDDTDPRLMTAATTLINAFSADFTLGGLVRNVDLLGMYGSRLGAQAGYVTIGGTMFRIMTVTLPCVVDDMWDQVGVS